MRYLVDMFDGKLDFINNIPEQTCIQISQAAGNVQEVLEMYALGACVRDALDELTEWCGPQWCQAPETANKENYPRMNCMKITEYKGSGTRNSQ